MERSDHETQFDFSQRDFDNYYTDILSRADAAKARLGSSCDEILRKTKQRKKLNAFMSELENRGHLLTEFDEALFGAIVLALMAVQAQTTDVLSEFPTKAALETSL